MSVLIFIVVIVVLIVVHEFGHFVVAKWTGMRVDEFGLGFPPRAMIIADIGGTKYTLNWLPFGGFVKIHGEDGLGEADKDPRAFSSKSRFAQALVLVAGVAMNLLLAYVLITGALIVGTPRALSPSELANARNAELLVANVMPNTPAARAGLLPGDSIMNATNAKGTWQSTDLAHFTSFIAESDGAEVTLTVKRNSETKTLLAQPVTGIITNDPSRYALGVTVAPIGVVPLSFWAAIIEGAQLTWGATVLTAKGLWHFFAGVFTMSADWSQIAGPVGIAGVVGDTASEGIGNLLSLIAIISINLAIINLIPIPALDGGRLLFVIIESVIRRPIKPVVARSLNAVGFIALILLMVVVTAHDIFKIVG